MKRFFVVLTLTVTFSGLASASEDRCLRAGLKAITAKVVDRILRFEVTDVYYNDENAEKGPIVLASIKDTETNQEYRYSVETEETEKTEKTKASCHPSSGVTFFAK